MKKIISLLLCIIMILSATSVFADPQFYVEFEYGDYTYSLDYDLPKETSTKKEIILKVVKYNGADESNATPVKSIPATELIKIIYNGEVTNELSERLNIAAQEGRSMYVRKSLTVVDNLVVDVPKKDPNEITVIVNGKVVVFDQTPIISEGRTLVPLRAIFEALNATVQWDDATKTVNAIRGETKISLQIGSTNMYVGSKVKVLDVPAQIINSRTLVPVRAISEAFGCTVGWDGNTKTVTITE